MSKDLTYDEIVEIEKTRPHVVILGAGATMATIPNGDKNGRPCSVMHGFMQNIGLETILQKVNFETQSENIENIFKLRQKSLDDFIENHEKFLSRFGLVQEMLMGK